MTREEAKEQLKFMLKQMPEEPPLNCDNIEEWYDTDIKIRMAYAVAIIALKREPDVVERSKIDKAILEMKEEYDNFKYSANKTLGASFGIRKAIEILEKNLGEEYE